MNKDIKEYLQPGKKNILLIYVLYLLGTIITIFPLIGVGFAFVYLNQTDQVWQSHYRFALRTFILGIVAITAAIILSFLFMSISVFFIGFLLYLGIFVWFIVRSIVAIGYLMDNKPHPDPYSLWIK